MALVKNIAVDVRTRFGIIPAIVLDGKTIAFKFGADCTTAADRHRARRAAVAWMATNPAASKADRYRFDAGDNLDAF